MDRRACDGKEPDNFLKKLYDDEKVVRLAVCKHGLLSSQACHSCVLEHIAMRSWMQPDLPHTKESWSVRAWAWIRRLIG